MYRAFKFTTDPGGYWSVIDGDTYETCTVADRFLQYMRFAVGVRSRRRESTPKRSPCI